MTNFVETDADGVTVFEASATAAFGSGEVTLRLVEADYGGMQGRQLCRVLSVADARSLAGMLRRAAGLAEQPVEAGIERRGELALLRSHGLAPSSPRRLR